MITLKRNMNVIFLVIIILAIFGVVFSGRVKIPEINEDGCRVRRHSGKYTGGVIECRANGGGV